MNQSYDYQHFLMNVVCSSKNVRGRCAKVGDECWCYHSKGVPANAVCGYPNDYNQRYYSLALDSTQSPKAIIEALGETMQSCTTCNCASNTCSANGCTGSSNKCETDQYKWRRIDVAGIARCRNMEGNFLVPTQIPSINKIDR